MTNVPLHPPLALDADERPIVVPWASVKPVEISPLPPALPFGFIGGARILQSNETQPTR